jgi:hypothetical protein
VGGLASVAGGGKFANGAVTGAFQYLATSSLEDAQQSREENFRNANAFAPAAPLIGAAFLSDFLFGTSAVAAAYGIWKSWNIFKSDSGDLTDQTAKEHILDGDNTGGGHWAGTGRPGKSEFPGDWSDEKVLGEVSDVATDPASTRVTQGSRTVSTGTRGGIDIRTVDDGRRIITGYPTNVPRNP